MTRRRGQRYPMGIQVTAALVLAVVGYVTWRWLGGWAA